MKSNMKRMGLVLAAACSPGSPKDFTEKNQYYVPRISPDQLDFNPVNPGIP